MSESVTRANQPSLFSRIIFWLLANVPFANGKFTMVKPANPQEEKIGVLLLNLGGPETLDDVRPFLFNLFSDPDIIRLPFRFMQKPIAWLIASRRHKKSGGYYSLIGGGSPLRKITGEQAQALESALRTRGIGAQVYVAMRYWHPFTEEA